MRDLFDSPADRDRVRGRIGKVILDFFAERRERPVFYMGTLEEYISARGYTVAPGSPCRILRMLRQDGLLDYTVTNRSRSEYTFNYGSAAE